MPGQRSGSRPVRRVGQQTDLNRSACGSTHRHSSHQSVMLRGPPVPGVSYPRVCARHGMHGPTQAWSYGVHSCQPLDRAPDAGALLLL
jgi:hypothetical protein